MSVGAEEVILGFYHTLVVQQKWGEEGKIIRRSDSPAHIRGRREKGEQEWKSEHVERLSPDPPSVPKKKKVSTQFKKNKHAALTHFLHTFRKSFGRGKALSERFCSL